MKLKEKLAVLHTVFATQDSLINQFRAEDIKEAYLKGWESAFHCILKLPEFDEETFEYYNVVENDSIVLIKQIIKQLKEKEE